MPADIARASRCPGDSCHRQWRAGLLHHCWAAAILLIGIFWPGDWPGDTAFTFWMNLQPAFGLTLLGFVVSCFYWHLAVPRALRQSDMRQFSRQLSRNVYLLLYVTMFLKEMIELIGVTWHDRLYDSGSLESYWQMPTDQVIDAFRHDFRGNIAGGVLAIIVIRLFTAVYVRYTESPREV